MGERVSVRGGAMVDKKGLCTFGGVLAVFTMAAVMAAAVTVQAQIKTSAAFIGSQTAATPDR